MKQDTGTLIMMYAFSAVIFILGIMIFRGIIHYFYMVKTGVRTRAKVSKIKKSKSNYKGISTTYYDASLNFTAGGIKVKANCWRTSSWNAVKRLKRNGLYVYYNKNDPNDFVMEGYSLYSSLCTFALWLFFLAPILFVFVCEIIEDFNR
ncbi:MAG: hypothetical protein J6A07_02085 [Firmicutes bacterium]|nr:hypothetical protein [Bacillota bacterium]